MYNLLNACATKEEVFSITTNITYITIALRYTANINTAMILLSCIDLSHESNINSEFASDMLLDSLPNVKSVAIAELIHDKFTAAGIAIDFTELPALVPYYATELDLQLVSYFIRNGGNPGCFISEYLQDLCAHDASLRDILQPHIEEQLRIEAEIEEAAERRILDADNNA